jgi:hypothetical protein
MLRERHETGLVTAAAACELDFPADRAFVNGLYVSSAGAAAVARLHGEVSESAALMGGDVAAPARAERGEDYPQDQQRETAATHESHPFVEVERCVS